MSTIRHHEFVEFHRTMKLVIRLLRSVRKFFGVAAFIFFALASSLSGFATECLVKLPIHPHCHPPLPVPTAMRAPPRTRT